MSQVHAEVPTDGPQPPADERRKLLQDARSTRNEVSREKARVKNLMNSALEEVEIYQSQLQDIESQLFGVDDLIGDIIPVIRPD